MIRSKTPASRAVSARAEDYPETTPECHAVAQRLNDVLRHQHEHTEALQAIAATLQSIDEKLAGHTKPTLTVAEASELVIRTEGTIRRWIKCGKLKADRVQGTGPRGRLLIRREALVALLEHGVGEDIPAVAISATPTTTDK